MRSGFTIPGAAPLRSIFSTMWASCRHSHSTTQPVPFRASFPQIPGSGRDSSLLHPKRTPSQAVLFPPVLISAILHWPTAIRLRESSPSTAISSKILPDTSCHPPLFEQRKRPAGRSGRLLRGWLFGKGASPNDSNICFLFFAYSFLPFSIIFSLMIFWPKRRNVSRGYAGILYIGKLPNKVLYISDSDTST